MRRVRVALLLLVGLAGLVPGAAARAQPGGLTQGTFEGRGYRLFVPAGVPRGERRLAVALHGCWQTPEDLARGTRLDEAAGRRGLLVVYPAQTRRDNPYRCWNWFQPVNQSAAGGETGQVLALARKVQDEHGVTDRRLVVLGISAGGFMAVNLACAAPQVVAGIGVVAAGPFRCATGPEAAIQCMRGQVRDGGAAAEACRKAAGGRALALRASLWHGALDAVVSPANLTSLETMFARAIGAASAETEPRAGAVYGRHRDARGVPVLETWLVPGMGHAWSGGDPRGSHTYPPGPDATAHMLDFLLGPAR